MMLCTKNWLNEQKDSHTMQSLDSGTWKVLFGYSFTGVPDGTLHLHSAGQEALI